MVEFINQEGTVSTPAVNIIKILLIQKAEYIADAWEEYFKKKSHGVSIGLHLIKARVITLLIALWPYLERTGQNPKEIYNKLENGGEREIWETTIFLNKTMDILQVTRIDLRQKYDRTDIEAENMAHGL